MKINVDNVVSGYRVGGSFINNICDEDADCEDTYGVCQMEQGDYNGNGCGDVCECLGDTNDDGDVDGSDAFHFKDEEWGRADCALLDPCIHDYSCDGDVDGSDAFMFKENFGREDCPDCTFTCSY